MKRSTAAPERTLVPCGRAIVAPLGLSLLAVLAILVGAGPSVAHAAGGCELYAAASGNDGGTGSASQPFKTLHKLAVSLQAGQTGCLESGQTFDQQGNVALGAGETNGAPGRPITITSTNPSEPATITHSLALESGASYVTFSHLNFNWSLPKPWLCWNREGDPVSGHIVTGPSSCSTGSSGDEDAVQIVLGGVQDELSNDEVTSDDTNICVITAGLDATLEHDRIHDCGPTVEPAGVGFPTPNEEWGWHTHGVYDFGRDTVVRNNYIYDNARDGLLFYGSGEGAVAEHNILDHNGAGVWFGDDRNVRVAWNIITGSSSPRGVADYGIGSDGAGSGDEAVDNCLDGNASGEVENGAFANAGNRTGVNPLYENASRHEYTLQDDSPCVGYGPDTAQPQGVIVPLLSEAETSAEVSSTLTPDAPTAGSPHTERASSAARHGRVHVLPSHKSKRRHKRANRRKLHIARRAASRSQSTYSRRKR